MGGTIFRQSTRADSLGFSGNGYGHLAHHHVHHGEMFQVVVRLEKGISREEFHKDTPDREHVAREAPSEACKGPANGVSSLCPTQVFGA
jgi:hypothetical protein